MNRFFRSLLLGKRIQYGIGAIVVLFAAAFAFEFLLPIAKAVLLVFVAMCIVDVLLVHHPRMKFQAERRTPEYLSLGSINPVYVSIDYSSPIDLRVELIDELPYQFQERNMSHRFSLSRSQARHELKYTIRPTERGEHHFGHINLIVRSYLDLFARRVSVDLAETLHVLPSIILMKELEVKAFARIADQAGVKKVRRLGVSYEFEQVSPFSQGDDIRHINWKATGRSRELMVNRYEMERSQPIYAVICKGREMLMPFEGLSLLDHSVNSALALSNIALLKYDRMGLITFSDRIGSALKADNKSGQLKRIMNALYNETERQLEADYSMLSMALRRIARTRSLVFLYTNFETEHALDRALPGIRSLAKRHLLVVIVFRNTELVEEADREAQDLRGIYSSTLARKMMNEKTSITRKLQRLGVHTILTDPDKLATDTVNKYLDLKLRGLV